MLTWLTGSASSPPVLLKLRSSKTFILLTVATAVFADIFAYGIVVPVLPFSLESRVGVAPDGVQRWVALLLAFYGAALFATAPFCGWAADRLSSRRIPLLAGLVMLAASTSMLCVGKSIAMLAAGRILQGISAAVVWIVGLALLADTVGPSEIGTAMGYVSLSMSLAILVAPLLGGVVFEMAGYYAVFAMAFGLIALDVVLRLAMIEVKIAKQWLPDANNPTAVDEIEGGSPTDEQQHEAETKTPGPKTSFVDESTIVPPAPMRRNPSSTPPVVTKWFNRLPPVLSLLASRRILAVNFACCMQASLQLSFDAILPIFVRETFGWNSIGAGLIFLPLVFALFFSPLVGWVSDKYGPRWLAATGFLTATPLLILLRLVDHNSLRQKVLLCALLVLLGASLTIAIVPLLAEITYAVDAKARRHPPGYFGKNGAYAQAYSLFNMAWAAGSMLGPLVAGLINERAGWGTTTLVLGCVSAATIVPTVIWTGGSIWKERRGRRQQAEAHG